MKTYIGIDGGASGAIAALYPDSSWEAYPVAVACDEEGERRLSVPGNLRTLESIARRWGGYDNIHVCYERCRKNPLFGTRNNFANGAYDEFWRVLLEARGIPGKPVFPRTWQDSCLGRSGEGDTKQRAVAYIKARVENLEWLQNFNKAQRVGIVDAMCIALWARDTMTNSGVPPAVADQATAAVQPRTVGV